MKKITIFLALTTLFLSIQAQTENNVKNYNKFTNKAELSIVDSNYTKALKYYDKAFKNLEYPFARDYYNALLCATFTQENDVAFGYLEKLLYKGIEIEYFTDNKYLEPLHKDERWQVFIDTYPERMEKIQKGFNLELRQELETMVYNDQHADRKIIIDTVNNYTAFDSTVHANIKRFIEIVNEYGFPTEEMIGIDKPFKCPFHTVILTHYYQILDVNKNFKIPMIDTLLKKNILNGKFSIYHFMDILPSRKNDIYGKYSVYQIDNNIIEMKYSNKSLDIINENRKQLEIESYKDSQKKAVFAANKIKCIPERKPNEDAMAFSTKMNNAFKKKYFYIGINYTAVIIYPTKEKSEAAYEKKKDIINHLETENE